MHLQFFGAAQTVTGSKHLLTTARGRRILLDCGLFQGIGTTEMNQTFGFDPAEIDALVLSHAHIDHAGLIPRLVRQGFRGPIYATPATQDLCGILLGDSARIQETDLERVNRRRKGRGDEPLELLYGAEDVEQALQQFRAVGYHEPFQPVPDVTAEFFDAGHLLGSASVYLTVREAGTEIRIWFTGDVGRPNDKILRSPEAVPQADYVLCESTYGDRLHAPETDTKAHLLRIVQRTCVENQGKLIIPAFAVDRTQELVYALDQLASEGRLPRLPVYVDSPLAVNATRIMGQHPECFNPELLDYVAHDGNAFEFPNLQYVSKTEDSKRINDLDGPAVIISASGMAEAGRIKHHIRNHIHDPRCTILLVGYASPDSLAGALKRGDHEVRIFGERHVVKAKVEVMDSFSAHADYAELLEYLACQDPARVRALFLVHGEYPTQLAFRGKLHAAGFERVEIPGYREKVELN
jgi:metallo-beta-lactamase family protein